MCFDDHHNVINNLPWQAESPDLKIIEALWGMRNRFRAPSSLKQPFEISIEECHQIRLEIIQNLYDSISRRIKFLQVNRSPIAY